ncbi:UDP-N-acetylmuramoyl-L-alanyl-D-glutamate--2,6-diaminopimelate ligase [Roseateles amylovorans]|uniref:UDP-N-acetylmuramoyl-L-alanyl-D-glutamate--2,6-diaminopimelate ligase n=1 Tax=Roseateles amylovorans TaxID=2978473 RepID=A0ABY6B1C3_9BURK|nr:UDP-N-acetylmuramoyl-L-alanyl-D-glutamate--2,6-diaminopimelate ligase [Roseateles amylovorans]UXH77313.1 UDP-N-acetylmuramoyl-L-alanyl-D-glutamate--2,6-diaminopimelate ligase [Roseateles amylovorans]
MLMHLKSPEAAARWLQEWTPSGLLRTDSRAVGPGDAFIAWPGYAKDARQFVAGALAAGAATCLVEDQGVAAFGFVDARIAALPDLKARCGQIAAAFYGHPSARLDVLAVTGTNGKTSSAWWIAQALTLLGARCGVIGTLGVGQPPVPGAPAGATPSIEATGLTTPDPVRLQEAFKRMADDGYAACAIEASSIGVEEHRLTGTRIKVALFTNFTQDHLDYHGDMAAYWAAKRKLFAWEGLQAAVLNVDDEKGAALAAELAASGGALDLWTYGLNRTDARLWAEDLRHDAQGLAFTLREGAQAVAVQTALIGDYNVSNLLGVIAGLRALGHSLQDIARVAALVTPVPGRMQRVGNGRELPQVVVDYAHTPDALEKALSALQPLAKARGGALQVVFGCGGNRDPGKRPLMGAIAARLAAQVVLTSDNPRHEDPRLILADIEAGLPAQTSHQVIVDRAEAIDQAVSQAGARDVVLIAGKGHEDYQEIAGERRAFSDVQAARAALIERAGL